LSKIWYVQKTIHNPFFKYFVNIVCRFQVLIATTVKCLSCGFAGSEKSGSRNAINAKAIWVEPWIEFLSLVSS